MKKASGPFITLLPKHLRICLVRKGQPPSLNRLLWRVYYSYNTKKIPPWAFWTSSGPRGGVQGVRTPPFGPRCRLFNIGPKVGPPLGPPPPFLLVGLRWTPPPPFKNPGSAPSPPKYVTGCGRPPDPMQFKSSIMILV